MFKRKLRILESKKVDSLGENYFLQKKCIFCNNWKTIKSSSLKSSIFSYYIEEGGDILPEYFNVIVEEK